MAVYREQLVAVAKRASMPTGADPNDSDRRLSSALATAIGPVVIEAVTPQLDGGRHPVKRSAGETVDVEADIFREGHDLLAAVLYVREKDAARWEHVPMAEIENDRWGASFTVARPVCHEFAIEAWPDAFGTWQHDVQKKLEAGQDLALEVIEGRALLQAVVKRSSDGLRAELSDLQTRVDAAENDVDRIPIMLDPELGKLAARTADPHLTTRSATYGVDVDRARATFSAWYELFPRSAGTVPGVHGTFADAARRFPAIASLGFDIVYLPPIHPIGHAFRKGKNNSLTPGPDDVGSPWAIGNENGGHTAIEPALGTFDEFARMIDAAHANGLEIALDYALQCSPDHPWIAEHPEWFTFRPDGSIKYAENPPKKYQDIVNFNWYGSHRAALWEALRDVIFFWIERGVTVFRVDNPHTKPFAYWEWMIGEVRAKYPDTIFLAEAFTRPKVMYELAKAGFSQSYTYFTWRDTKEEIEEYLTELVAGETTEFFRPSFWPNTPDILPPYLQEGGRPAFRIKLALAATLSSSFGIYSGYELSENAGLPGREEYLDSEKYEIRVRDYDAPENLNAEIAAINRIRRENPALHDWRNVDFFRADDDHVVFFGKRAGDNLIFVAINLDPASAHDPLLWLPIGEYEVADEDEYDVEELLGETKHVWRGSPHRWRLDPQINPTAIFRVTFKAAYVIDNDPLWFKDAVIYQVHVKAFFDSNDDGIGDFPGITAKLDYIKELGATCIWLLPFFPSPMRDDGYDIGDYRNINPAFGTMHDFRQFVKAAHERGIRVLIELVVNHTSDQHAWFQRARRAKKGSNWRDFYVWSDSDKKYSGTRIIFTDTETSNWTWDPVAGEYYWHRFFSHQPDLNFDNPRVIEAIMNVMRYWLDTGVDGLRLDAVPYLCEREGTSNENLPETHGIIKIMRAVLDHEYQDKVFLAEANQWPEDVRQYFGDGDECHMAFHFPLMPRMFMAIAEEDRHPIIDIMRQTPDIPENCQWAIFLRNHDEMTLEMVTDRERDNMYRIYATEPRARINVGIRRRLAPLMENDRRKIELLLGLLLSMPGTPIVYYGDEIGMGDNIYLSDRDGVRTPMQWSVDRNGGFSRADPARLFLPPIMDPVYGFAAINVESQGRSPSSLINWLRKLIAVRQGYKVFGRGTLTFLMPNNRKVIAYVREYGDEKVLCVANLAHTAQQVVLDLSRYQGRVPVEMSGWSPFHAIAQDRYAVSLPGYGFYWFLLSDSAQAPKWYPELPGQMPEMHTLVLPRDVETTQLGGTALAVFERDVLPIYLPKQRWFGGKGAQPASAVLVDTARLDAPGVRGYLNIVDSGGKYFLPLVIGDDISEERATKLVRATLARTRAGAHSGYLLDALAVDDFAIALFNFVRGTRKVASQRGGSYVGASTERLGALTLPEVPAVRRMDVEQSNTSVVIGEAVMLKGYRRLHSGPQPELEIARFLDSVGYKNTPALYGYLEYVDSAGESTALCILQEFVESQGDGWSATLAYLERFFDRRKNLTANHDADQHDYHQIFLDRAKTIGIRTAELHRAFATDTSDPAFKPEPIDENDLQAWSERARESAAKSLETLEREIERVPADLRDFATSLLSRREEIAARLTLPSVAEAGDAMKTRYHGDYHLGQVLVVADDFKIVDFEGEPARPLEQRRIKSSPLRDVAGMLRSINYAAVAGLRGATADRGEDTSALAPFAMDWERRSIDAFLTGYRETIAGCSSYPADPAKAQRLLEFFILEKAFYEMSYELANRPAWVRIPLEGIRSILLGDPAGVAGA